ncbi:Heterokaryon incompatibility protein (HET) domain containing protein [Hyaloscypha variabilis]
MRLLNTESLELRFFMPSTVPDYVILSHRWNTQTSEECNFEDVTKIPLLDLNCPARKKQGFSKIEGACRLASEDGYSWIWIDSCCIDKSSSAELQEAINSMWNYYAESNICYVYMADVQDSEAGWDQRFRQSEWFTRGWTLQELIAPVFVEFYAEDWTPIGTKIERNEELAEITKINSTVLLRTREIDSFNAAEKLSWAAHRNVTRGEDEAYSLLGLFEVNMPLLYGEGRERAFIRLQEVIYNFTADHTLFLFRYSLHRNDQPLLADSPTRFCDRIECRLCLSCGLPTIQCLPPDILYTNIMATDRWATQAHEQIMTTVTSFRNEMSTTLPLLDYRDVSDKLVFLNETDSHTKVTHVAVLNHALKQQQLKGALCLLLRRGAGLEVFHRVRCFPAVLPHLGELAFSLQKTKMLICPGANDSAHHHIVDTTFSLKSDSFSVQEWSAKGINRYSITSIDGETTERQIRTGESGISKHSAEVSCQITADQDPTLGISLQLIKINKAWSIKEVAEIEGGVRPRGQYKPFRSSHLADRCSLPLSGGKTLSVGLRRLPAACRAQSSNSVGQYSYQITVNYF